MNKYILFLMAGLLFLSLGAQANICTVNDTRAKQIFQYDDEQFFVAAAMTALTAGQVVSIYLWTNNVGSSLVLSVAAKSLYFT